MRNRLRHLTVVIECLAFLKIVGEQNFMRISKFLLSLNYPITFSADEMQADIKGLLSSAMFLFYKNTIGRDFFENCSSELYTVIYCNLFSQYLNSFYVFVSE